MISLKIEPMIRKHFLILGFMVTFSYFDLLLICTPQAHTYNSSVCLVALSLQIFEDTLVEDVNQISSPLSFNQVHVQFFNNSLYVTPSGSLIFFYCFTLNSLQW